MRRRIASTRLTWPPTMFSHDGVFASSKSAMKTSAPELSALMTILRSVGPVISTRRRSRSFGSGPILQSPSRIFFVSAGNAGSSPASRRSCTSTRRCKSALLVLSSSDVFAARRGLWATAVSFSNAVASTPVLGGGYPVPDGSNAPVPGTCGPQMLNSNRSESWITVKPGTEDLVGSSKFFIGKWSTFYDFHLGSYEISNGVTVSNNQVQGYECTTLGGSQDMTINGHDTVPPS